LERGTNTEGSEVFETAERLGEARQRGERWSQTGRLGVAKSFWLTAGVGVVMEWRRNSILPAMTAFCRSTHSIWPPRAAFRPGTGLFPRKTPPPFRSGADPSAPGAALDGAGASLNRSGAEFRRSGASMSRPGAEFRCWGASMTRPGASFRHSGAAPLSSGAAPARTSAAPAAGSGDPETGGGGRISGRAAGSPAAVSGALGTTRPTLGTQRGALGTTRPTFRRT
jgi:hypothetical protein